MLKSPSISNSSFSFSVKRPSLVLILLNQYFLYSLEKFDMDFLAILTASSRLGFRRGSSASENLAKFHKAILG